MGIVLTECRIIQDNETQIVDSLNELRRKNTYVFTTGGIGPTHDDITAASVAKAFGVELFRNKDAISMIENHYKDKNKVLNPNSFIMADTPVGSTLIKNNVSGAPGFNIENVYVLAGVPAIVQEMFNNIEPSLMKGKSFLSKSIKTFVGESKIRDILLEVQKKFTDIDVGSYPSLDETGIVWCTTIVIRGQELDRINMATRMLMDMFFENDIEYKEESE